MTRDEVMKALESMGSEQTRKIFFRHGAKEPLFGVKVGDLKKIQKKVRKDHELAIELYDTGNSDAMYLAGLIADEDQIKKSTLDDWAKKASWYMISEYTVPWIAADSPHGLAMGQKWIRSNQENIASAGWATLSSVLSVTDNELLDMGYFSERLDEVREKIHSAANRVRYTMNGFVIAVGSYCPDLAQKAMNVARNIGKVDVNLGETACKVPLASDYIAKIIKSGRAGKKRKMARC